VTKNLVEVRNKFSKVMGDPSRLDAPTHEIASAFLDSQGASIPEPWREVTIIRYYGANATSVLTFPRLF
jgi:hypothetical protein